MSESALEHNEHREHAEHAAHSGDPFIIKVSVTIAILAVASAGISSLESIEEGTGIARLSEANLSQNKASDTWTYYQAERLKKGMYDIAGIQTPDKAAQFGEQSKRYDEESRKVEKEAREFEARVVEELADSRVHESRHHRLTLAATFLHIGIAVSTIAIIAKGQRWPWFAAVLLGIAGLIVAGSAYAFK